MHEPFSHPAGFRVFLVMALLSAAWLAPAQAAGPAQSGRIERADPLNAQAPVPPVTYASSLASFRRLGEDTRIGWKQANETVNRIGGWRAYAREANQPDSAPAASAASSPSGQHKH